MKSTRRTQAERTAATRTRVLDAAIAALIDEGIGGLSSPAVARRAGISRGALTHHFPSRTELLGATVEHLFAELVRGFRSAFEAVDAADGDRVERGLRILWSAFARPAHMACMELYALSRTDPEVAAQMLPAAAAHRMAIFELANLYFPDLTDHPSFRPGINAVLDAMMGMTVLACFAGWDTVDVEGQLALLHQMFVGLVEQPAS